MPKTIVINPGTHPELANAAAELATSESLARYFTGSMLTDQPTRLEHMLGPAFLGRLKNLRDQRTLPPEIQNQHLALHGFTYEGARLISRGRWFKTHDYLMAQRSIKVDQAAAREILRTHPDVVLGQLSGCRLSLEAGRRRGALTILNYSIIHHYALTNILEAEAKANPQWRFSMPQLMNTQQAATLEAEIAQADYILVGSDTVRRSFIDSGHEAQHVKLIHYGVPTFGTPRILKPLPKFEFLFVGQLSQRKGIFYLLEAFARSRVLRDTILTIIGPDVSGSTEFIKRHYPQSNINILGPLSHDDIAAHQKRADVFVLPSLAEGFALAALEALSLGVPCILTDQVLGTIISPENAMIVPVQSSETLENAMVEVYQDSALRQRLATSGESVVRSFSWPAYRRKLASFLQSVGA